MCRMIGFEPGPLVSKATALSSVPLSCAIDCLPVISYSLFVSVFIGPITFVATWARHQSWQQTLSVIQTHTLSLSLFHSLNHTLSFFLPFSLNLCLFVCLFVCLSLSFHPLFTHLLLSLSLYITISVCLYLTAHCFLYRSFQSFSFHLSLCLYLLPLSISQRSTRTQTLLLLTLNSLSRDFFTDNYFN